MVGIDVVVRNMPYDTCDWNVGAYIAGLDVTGSRITQINVYYVARRCVTLCSWGETILEFQPAIIVYNKVISEEEKSELRRSWLRLHL